MEYTPAGYCDLVFYLLSRRRRKRTRRITVQRLSDAAVLPVRRPPTIRIDFPNTHYRGDELTEEGAEPTLQPILFLYFDADRVRVEQHLWLDAVPPTGWDWDRNPNGPDLSWQGPQEWILGMGSCLYADPRMFETLFDILRRVGIDVPDQRLDVAERRVSMKQGVSEP